MHDIGVGQHLRDVLLDYKIGDSLWPGARRSSSGKHETTASSDAEATESATRDAEQRHWSNRITQVFGAISPATMRVDEIDENRHAKPDQPEQDMIDDVVRLMREKLKLDSSQQPSPAPAYGDIWRSVSNGASSLPEDVEEDLNDMKVEFDAQTGTIMLSQPDAGENERVGLRLEDEGWVVEDVQIERSPRAPTTQQAGTARTSTTAHEKYPQTQRMKVTPTEPSVRGAFWSMYNSLAESDPKQARSLLNLIRIKIEDFLKGTHEGQMAGNTLRTSSSRVTQPTSQRTQVPRGLKAKSAFKPVLKDGPEWKLDSWYRGSRQPPLGVRLENILNFLSDEDMDRCVNFEECYKEIGFYLNWLWEVDAAEQLHNASDDIRRMFYDAVCKMLVHKTFEDHHYSPSKMADGPPPKVPRPSTRLDWTNVKKNLLLPAAEAIGPGTSSYRKIYTRRIFPRPHNTVNTMLEEETQGIEDPQAREEAERRILEPFIEHTWEFWNAPEAEQRDRIVDYENLAVIESRAFERYSRSMPAWVKGQRLPRDQPRFLPDNKRILPNDPTSWARERGARRAGLMQLLTSFQSNEQRVAGPDRSLVMIPTPAAHELQVRKQTDGLQWKPPHVSAAELPPQLEVMPYTYWWRIYAQELRWVRYQAMLDVEQKFSDGRRWVTLPRNLICSGPFIWRMVDPDVQKLQDVLEEARTTVGLLQLAVKREPRPLLVDAVAYMQRAMNGEFPNGQPPRELRLRKDEWYSGGERRQPRFTTGDDFKWLQFLGSECANRQSYRGFIHPSKYLSHEYKLYQLFTKRLHKLMDDKGPSALFLEQKTRVTVEELLSRMNAGCHGPVKKVVFKPYDACHFLDRLSKSGHVRFELDLACYGVVQRPNIELFPEHRVRWPSELNRIDAELPQYPFDIEGYHRLIEHDGKTANLKTPDVDKGSDIYNFLVNLAFRLGWTLHSLSHEKERWQAPHRLPLETQVLRDAVQKFDQAATAAGSSDKDFPQQTRRREDMFTTLQELVRRANPGDWSADMTRREAVAMIRNRVTEEGEANLGLLAPARRKEYFAQGKTQIAYVPDVSWEWASVRVRGHRRQFWDMNRWAPHDDYLSDHWKDVRARDGILDWTQCYNPRVYDKTPQVFMRPKLRPYGYGEKVKFKPGRAIYPIGDTKRQREAVEDYMTDVTARGKSPALSPLPTPLPPFFFIAANVYINGLLIISLLSLKSHWHPAQEAHLDPETVWSQPLLRTFVRPL